jgi:hypothetical protein
MNIGTISSSLVNLASSNQAKTAAGIRLTPTHTKKTADPVRKSNLVASNIPDASPTGAAAISEILAILLGKGIPSAAV